MPAIIVSVRRDCRPIEDSNDCWIRQIRYAERMMMMALTMTISSVRPARMPVMRCSSRRSLRSCSSAMAPARSGAERWTREASTMNSLALPIRPSRAASISLCVSCLISLKFLRIAAIF